jgi:quercetin dioxygenase-like cupin family protein
VENCKYDFVRVLMNLSRCKIRIFSTKGRKFNMTTQQAIIRNQKDVELIKKPAHNEVYGKLLSGEKENGRLSAHLTIIKPGGEIIPHTHEVLEVIYIVKGEGSALVNGERKRAEPGTIVLAPAGSEHGFLNTGDTDIEMYCVFSPGIA